MRGQIRKPRQGALIKVPAERQPGRRQSDERIGPRAQREQLMLSTGSSQIELLLVAPERSVGRAALPFRAGRPHVCSRHSNASVSLPPRLRGQVVAHRHNLLGKLRPKSLKTNESHPGKVSQNLEPLLRTRFTNQEPPTCRAAARTRRRRVTCHPNFLIDTRCYSERIVSPRKQTIGDTSNRHTISRRGRPLVRHRTKRRAGSIDLGGATDEDRGAVITQQVQRVAEPSICLDS